MAKRGHKMQEFVAHASSVSCLSIGKKSCRLLVTGGEDHKVNLWAIGKPNFLMSLSGHTSPVESVNFDSGEVLVAAGASTGAIKLWDFEEAKIVRTLTGHRSNCTAVEFHPFGEFFASGSSDTNLKIWDIRKKGCIHTYKGHTRGISTIKFTPDGRWVVSGGLDNLVKVWDLTAGKLLHDFKFHEGKIRCIDFHPLEFLLATGSADRTVKFWDLETFELIGSTGPESTGICSMVFHPDGRTLFCGLDDSLKVFSWEPIICHDAVDMGWSTLSDLCIHEEKLVGCSYHQNRVGVWVADISFIGPYGSGSSSLSKGLTEKKFNLQENPIDKAGSNIKSNSGLTTMSQDDETKEIKNIYIDSGNSSCVSPRRFGPANTPEVALPFDYNESANPSLKKSRPKEVHTRIKSHAITRTFNVPDIAPINNPKGDGTASARRESLTTERISPHMLLKETHIMRPSNIKCEAERLPTTAESRSFSSKLSNSEIGSDIVAKPTQIQRSSNSKYDLERLSRTVETGSLSGKSIDLTSVVFPDFHNRLIKKEEARETCDENNSNFKSVTKKLEKILPPQPPATQENSGDSVDCSKEVSSARTVNGVVPGRTRSLVERWEQRERFSNDEAPTTVPSDMATKTDTSPSMKGLPQTSGRESVSATDEDVNEYLMQSHDVLLSTLRSRLTKLQVVRHFWERNEIKGAINAMRKLPDHSVQADVIGVLSEKMEIITLDLFSCLLPMLEGLLDSKTDRHVSVSLDILVKLVTIFGPVIHSTLSTSPSVGIDLQAELRRQCCEQCFIALQKINLLLPSLTRRGGLLANSAQELSLILQEP